jgi:hypothetical protein
MKEYKHLSTTKGNEEQILILCVLRIFHSSILAFSCLCNLTGHITVYIFVSIEVLMAVNIKITFFFASGIGENYESPHS